MYEEMAAYKKKSEALFDTAPKSGLSAEKEALLAKAHQFYDWDDFLDSYQARERRVGAVVGPVRQAFIEAERKAVGAKSASTHFDRGAIFETSPGARPGRRRT